MNLQTIGIYISTVTSLLIAIAGLYLAASARRNNLAQAGKASAETFKINREYDTGFGAASKALADAATSLVTPLKEQLDDALKQLEDQQTQIRELKRDNADLSAKLQNVSDRNECLEAGVEVLRRQVLALGQQPMFNSNKK